MICAAKKPTGAGDDVSEEEVEYEEEIEQGPVYYDKTKSFFDNISCDTRGGYVM